MEQHIIDAVLTVLGVAGTGFIGYLSRALVKFIVSKHLEILARQAVHYAEDAFITVGGQAKLKAACEWVSKRMKQYHIKIDEATIEGAVRAAYTIFVQAAQKEFDKDTSTNVHVSVDGNKLSKSLTVDNLNAGTLSNRSASAVTYSKVE